MRVPSARFAGLAAAFLALAPACNAIFGIEAGTPAPAAGTGGTSTTASHGATGGAGTGGTGGSAGCVPSCAQGMLTLCDAAGQPMPAKDCGAVALCDAVGQVCTTPPSIALGYRRGCAFDESHAVYCWGYNDGSPLQTGTLVLGDDHLMFPTAQLMDLQGVTAWQISVGDDHQCALQANGQVACWGDNENDQLGIEVPGDPSLNPMVDLPRNAVEVAAGAQCTCARLDDGTVWCWGLQDDGCLGDGTAGNGGVGVATPTEVQLGNQAVQIRAGDGRYTPFCARLTGGLVRCWGRGYGPITIPTVANATDIAVGPLTVFINTPDGLLWTQPLRPKAPATQVTFPDPQLFPVVAAPVTKLAAAYDLCTVASSKPAEVSCTGLFNLQPPVTGFPQPVSVTVPGPVLDLASGTGENYDSTMQCARVSGPAFAQSVYCWGDDSLGELGIGGPAYYLTPQKVTLDAAVSVACTESSTAAVLAGGTAHYWGTGYAYVDDGQTDFPSPQIPGVGSAPIALSGNDSWGWAYALQDGGAPPVLLTPGSTSTTPARLLTYSSTDYLAAVPALADLGLLAGGQVVVYADPEAPNSYGANDCGIFGDGSTTTSTTAPTAKPVPLPSAAVAIAAHGTDYDSCPAHACAILSTGALYCWGSNGFGRVRRERHVHERDDAGAGDDQRRHEACRLRGDGLRVLLRDGRYGRHGSGVLLGGRRLRGARHRQPPVLLQQRQPGARAGGRDHQCQRRDRRRRPRVRLARGRDGGVLGPERLRAARERQFRRPAGAGGGQGAEERRGHERRERAHLRAAHGRERVVLGVVGERAGGAGEGHQRAGADDGGGALARASPKRSAARFPSPPNPSTRIACSRRGLVGLARLPPNPRPLSPAAGARGGVGVCSTQDSGGWGTPELYLLLSAPDWIRSPLGESAGTQHTRRK